MGRSNIVTAVDIGSTKVCCCIARILDDGRFNLLGVGYSACVGMRCGVVIDVASVEKSIAFAVEQAEHMADYRVKSVYVSVSGKNIISKIVNASIQLGGRTVTEDDINHILSSCNHDAAEYEVIHLLPVLYSIDSLNGIKDPIGMIAHRFSVNVNAVSVVRTQLYNILACLSRCHLDVEGVAADGYAAGLYVIDDEERLENQIVVDMGGDSTSISYFYKGVFCGYDVVPIGGKHITSDIAYGLNVSIANAERLKTLHGAAVVSLADDQERVFAPVIEDDSVINLQQIPKSSLNKIISPRIEEILINVRDKIACSAFGEEFSRSVILTGGCSMLTGVKELADRILKKKTKYAKNNDEIDGADVQVDNGFSAVLGIIKFACIGHKRSSGLKDVKEDGVFKKILKWVENNL